MAGRIKKYIAEKKEILQGYKYNLFWIKANREMINRLTTERPPEIITDTPTSKRYDKKIKEIITEMQENIKRNMEACDMIEKAVNSLEDPTEKTILKYKYLCEQPPTWEQIAEEINYSLRQWYNIHNAALKHINL